VERAQNECILCGGTSRLTLIDQDRWRVHQCASCGLGVLDPRPDAEELTRLYAAEYFLNQYDRGFKAGSPELRRRLAQEDHRVRFFRGMRKRGHVLDIGCGMGYFLMACREAGYDVSGIDISEASAGYVRNELAIPVRTGAIEEIDIPEGTIDVVTMWHFLEHAPDPRIYLDKARRWLKEEGLVVVDVPNYRGTDAQKTWKHWKGWQLPYHLYHFTPETLTALLACHGFRTIRSKDYLSEYMREKISALPLIGLLARPIARCFSGHSVAVLARKEAT
jgi:2-polyprenyl-3-methyl-5-hydroxy-6-metoxy-1,4-benzoquinol methylase